jgi:4-hydroxyphenylpyruvate dioxygenase-like putative hemolysin
MEIAFVTKDVQQAHQSAIKHGAVELAAPASKPWGQTVSYVRAPDGTLIELCTPVGG